MSRLTPIDRLRPPAYARRSEENLCDGSRVYPVFIYPIEIEIDA